MLFGLAINCVCLLYLVTAEICFATAALVVADVNREPCCPVVALQDLTHLCACYPLSGWHPQLAGATPPPPGKVVNVVKPSAPPPTVVEADDWRVLDPFAVLLRNPYAHLQE